MHWIVSGQLQAEVAKGLGGRQGFQTFPQPGKTAQYSQLAHSAQTTATPHLEFQQGEWGGRCQAAFGASRARYGKSGQPLCITQQAEETIVFAEWSHLQG
jgi:hypothetical protein